MTSQTQQAAVLARLSHLASIQHITLIHAGEDPLDVEDPGAIVSPLPFLRVDAGDCYRGPRWRLRLGSSFTILARKRVLPVDLEDPAFLIRWAANRNGHPEPVACIDRRELTLHLLVDVKTLTSPDELASPELIADQLLGDLFERLLAEGGPVRTGPQVPGRALSLLSALPTPARLDYLRARLNDLESLPAEFGLRDEEREHRERLRRVLADPAQVANFDTARTGTELTRVARLVEKRAFAMIEFDRAEIRGLMNPRAVNGRVVRPLFFALALGRLRGRPLLRIWDLVHPMPSSRRGRCLGRGVDILDALEDSGDLYALLDFVMNFVETNRLGSTPPRFPPWEHPVDALRLENFCPVFPRSGGVRPLRSAHRSAEFPEDLHRLRQ